MNRSKSTLAIASIMVAGALTGVALAILLQQGLPYRHQHVYGLGTPGTSVDGANGANGANGALGVNGNNANAAIGINSHGPNGLNGYAVANSWVFLS
jgi:hypothetical protein